MKVSITASSLKTKPWTGGLPLFGQGNAEIPHHIADGQIGEVEA